MCINFASIHLSFSKDALCKISATLFATKCNENAKFDQIGEKLQKNILFRDNQPPFIQEQLMEKIKVNYKLALCSCLYWCHHVTTDLWINTKLENWFTSMGQRVWLSLYLDVEYVTEVAIPVCSKYFWVWVKISRINAYIYPLCLICLI